MEQFRAFGGIMGLYIVVFLLCMVIMFFFYHNLRS